MRKEVFSPSEKLETPLAINLIFMQIIKDYRRSACIRIGDTDKHKLKNFLDSKGMASSFLVNNLHLTNCKLSIKNHVIEIAKEWPFYFCRLFPTAVIALKKWFKSLNKLKIINSKGAKHYSAVQMIGISHSCVRLIKRERDTFKDTLNEIDSFRYFSVFTIKNKLAAQIYYFFCLI